MSNVIPHDYFRMYCRPGMRGLTCRYVTAGPDGICCEKHTSLRYILDQRAAKGMMVARGDNCEGLK